MNPILVDLGFIKIYWYSIMIFLGLLIGGIIIMREARRYKLSDDFMTNLSLFTIIFAVIGARLYYVAFNWKFYKDDLLEIVKIWNGGLAIHGAIIAGALFIIIFTKKHKVKTLRLMDIIVPGLLIGQAIGRWGNFFNGEAHGGEVTLEFLQSLHLPQFIIDGMYINGTYYHPTFLYESLWCLIGVVLLLIIRRRRYQKIGQTTALYLMWYSLGRFFIESLRTDSLMLGNFRVAQIISIVLFVIGLIMFIVKNLGSKLDNRYNDLENLDNVKY